MLPKKIKDASPTRKKRIRSPAHLKWVRSHHCCVPGCYQIPIEAAHVRYGTNSGMGIKPDDTSVISLCREHHSEQHRIGERLFEEKHHIDMRALAEEFAAKSPHRDKLRPKE